jgi:putative transposase
MQQHIHDLVDECHKKIVRFLVNNYDVILLPSFNVSGMVPRINRRISSKSVRQMLTWGHYRFKQRLLNAVREVPRCRVFIVNEAYTSKTCGACGTINYKLGKSKTFWCSNCPYVADRDFNGARNVLLRNASLVGLRVCQALGLAPTTLQGGTTIAQNSSQ